MPFVNRFASPSAPPPSPFSAFRNHPVMLASGAATAGVLLGAYVAVQLLGTPAKVDSAKLNATTAPQVAAQPAPPIASQPAPPIAETTGSAPAAEPAKSDVASVDCGKQTWPNISHDCLKGGPRTVSTEKPGQSNATQADNSQPANVAPPIAAKAEPKPEPSPQATVAARTVSAPSNPPPAAASPAVTPAQPTIAERQPAALEPQPAGASPVSKPHPKRFAKKVKRKPARPEFNDENSYAAEDGGFRETRRYDRSHRMAQRYERDDDRDDDGQRVIVIRRGGGGGLFGSLFGGFGDGD